MSDSIDEDDISFDTACEMGLDPKYFQNQKSATTCMKKKIRFGSS